MLIKIKEKHTLTEDQQISLISLLKSGELVNTRTSNNPCYYLMTHTENGLKKAQEYELVYYFDREIVDGAAPAAQ